MACWPRKKGTTASVYSTLVASSFAVSLAPDHLCCHLHYLLMSTLVMHANRHKEPTTRDHVAKNDTSIGSLARASQLAVQAVDVQLRADNIDCIILSCWSTK